MAGKQAKLRAKERRKIKPYDKKGSGPAAALGERTAEGGAVDDADKANDELELEAFLFGRKKKSARKAPVALAGGDPNPEVEETALGHLADQEVRRAQVERPCLSSSGH